MKQRESDKKKEENYVMRSFIICMKMAVFWDIPSCSVVEILTRVQF
jgi:hypothetical protein